MVAFFIEKNKRNKINHISHVGLSLFKDNVYIFKNKVYLFIYVNYVNLLQKYFRKSYLHSTVGQTRLSSITCNDSAKSKAWKSHYERLLNVEFMWNSDSLPNLNPKIGLPLYITEEMISKAIAKMKTGKGSRTIWNSD